MQGCVDPSRVNLPCGVYALSGGVEFGMHVQMLNGSSRWYYPQTAFGVLAFCFFLLRWILSTLSRTHLKGSEYHIHNYKMAQ